MPKYSVSEPSVAWRVYDTTNATENAWAATNSAFVAWAGSWSADTDTNKYAAVGSVTEGEPAVRLHAVHVGFPVERAQLRYYLGGMLTPPNNYVDWDATYAYFLAGFGEDASVTNNFLFDKDGKEVYVTRGENSVFKWILKKGGVVETNDMLITAMPVSKDRPKNIFLTDSTYGGRTVDLTGKFVKLFGPDNLLKIETGEKDTGVTMGGTNSTQRYVKSGVYVDDSGGKKTLYAAGEISGQFVLAYYDSGNCQKLVDVITVQVSPPETIVCNARVGNALKPTGRGYRITGLTASPTTLDDFDEQGPFLYQHKGEKAYSAKNGDVFALRPSDKTTRNQTQIYWFERDNQGVQWPFEVNEYLVSWPDSMPVLVRGDEDGDVGKGMTIPSVYTAELMDYQESDAGGRHATGPVDGVFAPTGAGLSLLKLVANDNVWFVPVRSVLRGDPAWFLPSYLTRKVGMELGMRTIDSMSGLAEGRALELAEDVPGYIYGPATTKRVWNPDLYSESGTGAGGCPSVIYPVTASMDAAETNEVEVWWSAKYLKPDDDMPEPLVYPAAPQNYYVTWPIDIDSPDIVIASQLGSALPTLFRDPGGHCLAFEGTNAMSKLDSERYFSEEGGMVGLWHARSEDASADAQLFTLGDVFTIKDDDQPVATGNGWKFLAVSWTTNKISRATVLTDGTIHAVTNDFTRAAELAGVITNAYIGGAYVPFALIDSVSMWRRPLSEAEIVAVAMDPDAVDQQYRSAFHGFENEAVYIKGHSDVTNISYQIVEPGGPRLAPGIVVADAPPTVYRQPVSGLAGFNPNEEHGFVQAGAGGYVTWAMRCDLNAADNVSKPGVLVEYVQDGAAKMAYFDVKLTNEVYRTLSDTCEAGLAMPGPHPFLLFSAPYLAEDYWTPEDSPVPYRDRKGQIWLCCEGDFDIYMYYAMQDDYDWPSSITAARPEFGTAVPWLAYLDGNYSGDNRQPAPWTWHVKWPDPDKVPHMKIGQTLTTAADGLPEVWNAKSMALLYPVANADETALLYDPTCSRAITTQIPYSRLKDLGLSAEPNGKLHSYKGQLYFRDAPPSVSDRIYIDVAAAPDLKIVLKGVKDTDAVGELHVNVLADCEREALVNIIETSDEGLRTKWNAAVAKLATGPVKPTETVLTKRPDSTHREYCSTYAAADHYALTAMGMTNWVVLIENDATNSFCDAGNPINMHVFRIVPEYNLARVVTREDPANLLSQQLAVSYTEHFAGRAGDYLFEWRKAKPLSNGKMPVIDESSMLHEKEAGLTTFIIGAQGDTLDNMVNTYYNCRYRAVEGTAAYSVMGDKWSDWCSPPGLAEGWVQRVLNNVTPFTQRVTDLYENAVDSSVSMQTQAGAPYTGDVALNMDNLKEVGLIQLYRTILAKAESMSLMMKINDEGANKQLLLAVERLADLYGVLGDEAYTDALNPTIGFGATFSGPSGEVSDIFEYGAYSTSLFCFDNQMPSLLDEELALMRGRSCVNAPDNTVGPCYNRLVWNFTKGITAGEVAYAVNYDISGVSETGTMGEEEARAQFPQGHGDAYGHYLSALQGYYRLLRNPYFSWDGIVGMGEMNVANNAVNVDYYDEATFAKFAANVAKTAAKTVELTALKHWRDNYADTAGGGYVDANVTNAFGYGEWASRGGFGALCNWAVANDLLPEAETVNDQGVAYEDLGLLHIDRGTAEGIAALASAVRDIQRTTDRMDAGTNPLGLNDKAVPFDLTPIGGAGDATHFEQVRERAQTALVNAANVLDKAQDAASRRRMVQEITSNFFDDRYERLEQEYKNELVAIYGKPYSDDIGAGKTYPENYDGPDYYHFMWMDLSDFGLTSVASAATETYTASGYNKLNEELRCRLFNVSSNFTDTSLTLTYQLTSDGVVAKPDSIRGDRLRAGELQLAYADFLTAYAAVLRQSDLFKRSTERMTMELGLVHTLYGLRTNLLDIAENQYGTEAKAAIEKLANLKKALVATKAALQELDALENAANALVGVVGLAVTAGGDVTKILAGVCYCTAYSITLAAQAACEGVMVDAEQTIALAEMALRISEVQYETAAETAYVAERVIAAADEQLAILPEINAAWAAMETAQTKVATLLAQADGIRDELQLLRQQTAKNVSKMRYYEMFFREVTNDALSQYGASFAIARTYALLAAKAYGYETGSPLESTEEGREILRQIVGARMIGALAEDGSPVVSSAGDAGLSGVLAKLDANWANRKTQLGINNPQPYATWFSLRHELFRILQGELGDNAWQTELAKCWVEDVKTDAEFQRHCQPFASQFGLAEKEPALVIPFETTIDFAYNLFGKPLAFDDSQFDSTYYATKIASAGVWFEGYNEKRAGYKGASAFAKTPNVYLVPVGTDKMRVPGSDGEEIASFNVLDQTIPAPYPLTAAEIAESNWLPSYLDGDLGGVDGETRIRRHPSFRAYFGDRGSAPDDAMLDATRLTGRSVWNTRWLLVIPAGTLGSDRDQALKAFIYGLDTDRDGIIDVKPVSDIKIGFKTYSIGGK